MVFGADAETGGEMPRPSGFTLSLRLWATVRRPPTPPMRRLFLVAVLVAALSLPAGASGGSLFLISGRGWGHGVGLSQYGAYGFAQSGASYDQILAHYYPGTTLGPAPLAEVRVLLAGGRKQLEIASAAPFTVADASGQSIGLEAGTYVLDAALRIVAGGEERQLVPPVRFDPGASPLELGRPYHGSLVVLLSEKGKLSAVNYVGLEQYVYGVVPGEMPADWAAEALKAQAVAARSYALASRRPTGDFDLYADTRSQVYGGIAAEDPRTSAAVDATAGQVVLFEGAVAQTFFFSTSGGRTAASADVWGQPLPYLVPVEDPFDSLSPFHVWGPELFTGKRLAELLGPQVPRGLRDFTVSVDSSGRVSVATLVGGGASAEVRGAVLRSALTLRSTWFDVGVLSLPAPPAAVVLGQRVTLGGVVRGVEGVSLERKLPGGVWEPVGTVTVQPDGTFTVDVGKPKVSTLYRLVSPSAPGVPARVRVAARVKLYPPEGGELRGRVRPKVEGALVEIQRLDELGAWATVAVTTTDAVGEFRVELALEPGTYRAVARVGGGLVPGQTPPLEIAAG